MAAASAYSLGLDFGTNSVRALIVDARDGAEVAGAVAAYTDPDGEAGVRGDPRDPNLARQHPAVYAPALARCVRAAVRRARRVRGFAVDRIVGIGIDATASTPLPVDDGCRPLALHPRFADNLDACAWLWKDHTAHAEAREITDLARAERPEYLARCGGTYSSEWLWSKVLRCRRVAPAVFRAAHSWLELCDYVPALLTGCPSPARVRRSVCAAGHKALFEPPGGLPDAAFLGRLHPDLASLRARMYEAASTCDAPAGGLSSEWARRLGLRAGTPVAVGGIDAHVGAVGAGIGPGVMVKIIGTSSCDMLVAPGGGPRPAIPGVCGVVEGSILPGWYGIEAGQPAVGDLLHWWVTQFDRRRDAHEQLMRAAARLRPGESGLLALDWNNGNRSVLVDVRLTGLLVGQTLRTTPVEVYRALIEATAFGARKIVERIEACRVGVRRIVACGGVARRNPLLTRIYADVLGRPIMQARSEQTCALGAAIFGAVVGGAWRRVEAAQRAMCRLAAHADRPERAARQTYDRLYGLYSRLHDAFGVAGSGVEVDGVMKELISIREQAGGDG